MIERVVLSSLKPNSNDRARQTHGVERFAIGAKRPFIHKRDLVVDKTIQFPTGKEIAKYLVRAIQI